MEIEFLFKLYLKEILLESNSIQKEILLESLTELCEEMQCKSLQIL